MEKIASTQPLAATGSFLAIRSPGSQGDVQLTFEAQSVEVRESSPAVASSSDNFQEAGGRIIGVRSDADLLLSADATKAHSEFSLNRVGGPTLATVSDAPKETSAPAQEFGLAFQSADDTPMLSFAQGALTIEARGSLTLDLYGLDVAIYDARGAERVYRTGNVPAQPGLPLHQENAVRLRLEDAKVHLALADRDARLYFDTAQLRTQSMDLFGARGTVTTPDADVELAGSSLTWAQPASLRLARGADRSFGSHLSSESAPAQWGSGAIVRPHAAIPQKEDGYAVAWSAGVGITLAGTLGLALIIRPRIRAARAGLVAFEAERALRQGEFEKAQAQAETVLASGEDATAVVAKSISMLQLHQDEEAFEFATTHAPGLPQATGVLAYVAAVAATRSGRIEEGARWLGRAVAAQPELMDEASKNPEFAPLRARHPGMLDAAGIAAEDVSLRGYA